MFKAFVVGMFLCNLYCLYLLNHYTSVKIDDRFDAMMRVQQYNNNIAWQTFSSLVDSSAAARLKKESGGTVANRQ